MIPNSLNSIIMKLINGKEISAQIRAELTREVAKIIDNDLRPPHLAAVLVGNDPASETYVASKEKQAKECGFTSSVYRFPEDTPEKDVLEAVGFLNNDPDVDGFIVQLPLPAHIQTSKVIEAIDPRKDVDGFHPMNAGRMLMNLPSFLPATPAGILELIKRYGIETEGKHCVVLGRSNIVGTPVSVLMSRKAKPGNSTVTLCHSQTQNLEEICRSADILIAAIGQPLFVKADMVKKGAVVIDVGIHRVSAPETKTGFKLIGDVDFDEVAPKTSYITPVPGGVGPMTIAMLLSNTLKASRGEIYNLSI
jgi:methylenetetrahydrofolate dehydrogenase (NADP+) / methenyltetrahydrofolate cyclohydrolase